MAVPRKGVSPIARDEQIRVIIADDHKLFRDGIRKLLETEPDMIVVGEASDGVDALRAVREREPDILLFDINMPRLNGVQLIRELSAVPHRIEYVAISAYDTEENLSRLSSMGVIGYVLKASGKVELLSAIRSAAQGQPYVDAKVAGRLLTAASPAGENDKFHELTPREKEALYWLAQGFSNGEIAGRMVLSEKTVKNHVSHLLRKLDLRDRTQAAVYAWRIGFAQLPEQELDENGGGVYL